MYHLTLFVTEMMGCTGISGHLWDRDDLGRSHAVADIPVRYYEPTTGGLDPLVDLFDAVKRFSSQETTYTGKSPYSEDSKG